MKARNCVVVCGPTASGKTRLGVDIALHRNGEIISCDSRQVYRGMDIGTGKDLSEYRAGNSRVPYHLIDIVDPISVYTVYQYQQDFYRSFKEIAGRRHLPVVVGGTGLYLESVLRNYRIPAVPENPEFRRELMRKDKAALEEMLRKYAPDLFQVTDKSSKKRIARALEIASFRSNKADSRSAAQVPEIKAVVLCTAWDRDTLYERIAVRLNHRLAQGMVEEVSRLLASGVPRQRLDLFGMEYRHIVRFLCGEVHYEKMVAELLSDIRHFAKRQETWFRGMERRGIQIFRVREASFDAAAEILDGFSFSA